MLGRSDNMAGRYAAVGGRHVVVRSAYKHTPMVPDEPTKAQKKAYAKKMAKDLEKKYQLIREMTGLGLLEVIWHDNFVEFRKSINGVRYDDYGNWLAEQKKKEKEQEQLLKELEEGR